MQIIQIEHPQTFNREDFPPLAVALGFFDGIHLGHREVIAAAKQTAKDHQCHSAVMTFDPHPSAVLGKRSGEIHYITPLEEKINLLEGCGLDYLFIVHFTETFSSLAPEEFVDRYLNAVHAKWVIAGYDYTYGKFGKGTMETLPVHAKGRFEVKVVPKLEMDADKVSSTAIRQLLADGSIGKANQLLGRPYTTRGTVVHGDKRGRTIGFPTANLQMAKETIIPKTGVYAVKLFVRGEWHKGVGNVGYRPTFNDPEKTQQSVEVYLFNFDASIYDEHVIVEWHNRIRDEIKFAGVEALIAQIKEDAEKTWQFFSKIEKET